MRLAHVQRGLVQHVSVLLVAPCVRCHTPFATSHLTARAKLRRFAPSELNYRFVDQLQYLDVLHVLAFDTQHVFHLEMQTATRREPRNGTVALFAMKQFELLGGCLLLGRLAHSSNGPGHQNGDTEKQNHGCQHVDLWRNTNS